MSAGDSIAAKLAAAKTALSKTMGPKPAHVKVEPPTRSTPNYSQSRAARKGIWDKDKVTDLEGTAAMENDDIMPNAPNGGK